MLDESVDGGRSVAAFRRMAWILLSLIVTTAAANADMIANVTGFVDASVAVPPGARGVVRFFPGGGMGTLGQNGWAPNSVPLGFVGDGTLMITVEDLGPATCNGLLACAPVGAVYPGNTFLQGDVYEAILNQKSLGYTEPVTPNGDPTTPIAFVPNLSSFTFIQPVSAGNYTLYFDDLTIAYLGAPAPVWPAASVFQANNANAVPPDFETDAFQVTVNFVAPEPDSLALSALGGLALAILLRRRGRLGLAGSFPKAR